MVVVTGADTPLGAAVVGAAHARGLEVVACGGDQTALAGLARRGVLSLTLTGADRAQVRVLGAVLEDRYGGVLGVIHLDGHGRVPDTPASIGARVAAVAQVHAGLPAHVAHAVAVEESGRRGDPAEPLLAASGAALAGWATSVGPLARVVWVPSSAAPDAWARPLLRAVAPDDLRGRVAERARRFVRLRG